MAVAVAVAVASLTTECLRSISVPNVPNALQDARYILVSLQKVLPRSQADGWSNYPVGTCK